MREVNIAILAMLRNDPPWCPGESASLLPKLWQIVAMRRIGLVFIMLLAGLVSASAAHTQVSLLLAAESVRPGDTIQAGVRMKMDPHWHTYWRNPGAAGIATKIDWKLPAGVTVGEIEWPIPNKRLAEDLTTYDYSDEVVLLVPIQFSREVPLGKLELKGTAKWLECDQTCIPGKGDVSAILSVGAESKPSADAPLLEAWRKKLPQDGSNLGIRAIWDGEAKKDSRFLVLEWGSAAAGKDFDFFPNAYENFEVGWKTESPAAGDGRIRLRKEVKKFEGDWPKSVEGLLVQHLGEQVLGYQIKASFEAPKAVVADEPPMVVPGSDAHTQVRLIFGVASARPGDTILVGVELQMEPQWHTFWRNAGGPGIPTRIDWQLPAGITAAEPLWPVPEKTPAEDLTTFTYSDKAVLLVPFNIAPTMAEGNADIKASVSWQECNNVCIPRDTKIAGVINIGRETVKSPDAASIDEAKKRLPQNGSSLAARAFWENEGKGNERPLIVEWTTNGSSGEAEFFAYGASDFEVGWKAEVTAGTDGRVRLRKVITKSGKDWPTKLEGVLVPKLGKDAAGYELSLPIGVESSSLAALGGGGATAGKLIQMLIYAFLGGLILNVMPCVLPVIALKILSFVKQGHSSPAETRKLGLIYGLGVLCSFLAMAGLVIGVKVAGHRAGWGMQFSSPEFVVVLTVLVTLVALNLFGVFEVNLSGKVLGAAGDLSSKEGSVGAFFNGVLATVLATPCTAPFLAGALGFAFAQPYLIIVLIFLAAGAGLAFPYVVLSWNPAWLKILPRPGVWMERFKVAMGFPMLATAFWLFELTPGFYGERVIWLGLFLVIVALSAWIYGEFIQRGRSSKPLAFTVFLLILVSGFLYTIESKLQWHKVVEVAATGSQHKVGPDEIDWQPWSVEAVAEARKTGRPILVDFTAKWCTTCRWNLAHSIDVKPVRDKLKEINAFTFVADYSNTPDNITDELARFQRAGVPMVLVYPRDPKVAPQVFDGLLTQGTVLEALTKAAQN